MLVPGLLDGPDGDAEREAIEELIVRGDGQRWLAHLRSLTDRLLARGPASEAGENERTVALILRDQFLLAPGMCVTDARDDEALARLETFLGPAAIADA